MKDYSEQVGKYAIIEHFNVYAIVEVRERDANDASEIIEHKPGTLSISKSISTLQGQIREMYERESTPMVSGLQRWKEAKGKQRRMKERVSAK